MRLKLFHHLFLFILCVWINAESFAQSNNFNYPVAPGTTSSDLQDVGSPKGSLSVSPLGGATYAIPIEVPVGLPGATPQIGITYNSQDGNGVAGYGCNISGISVISRGARDIFHDGTAYGISYTIDDAFFMDGQRLICVEPAAGSDSAAYCLESDPYIRVVLHGASGNGASGLWFSVTTKDGLSYEYGTNSNAIRSEYYSSGYEDAWYICRRVNQTGNYIQYGYTKDNLFIYLSYILYGQNEQTTNPLQNRVDFTYEDRDDAPSFRIRGHIGSMAKRLRYIISKTGNDVYRKYSLSYDTDSDGTTTKFSRLTSVTESNSNNDELKPITLEWQYLPVFTPSPQNVSINLNQGGNNNQINIQTGQLQLFAGDLNGDGVSDIIQKEKASVQINGDWTDCSAFYTFKSSVNQNNTVTYNSSPNYYYIPLYQPNWDYWGEGPLICDFNGDSRNDILIPYVSLSNPRLIRFYCIDGSTSPGNNVPPCSSNYCFQASTGSVLYTCEDFDRDGRSDIIVLETSQNNSGSYEVCIFRGASSIGASTTVRTTFTLGGTPRRLFTGDYNGDGLSDLMISHTNGYQIFWNQGGGLTATTLGNSFNVQNPWISAAYRIYSGDFNGDGLTDFLTMGEDTPNWYIHLGNGDGTFSFYVACSLSDIVKYSYSTEEYGMYFTVFVYDMDGDGKSDVFISKAKYNGNDVFDNVHTYWLKSEGTTLTTKKHLVSNDKDNASLKYHMAGDFNGDGLPEIANYGFNSYNGGNRDTNIRTYACQNFTPTSGKVISITNGYGKKTGISYGKLTNPAFYTKGTDGAYPVADCTPPIHVVTGIEENKGTGYAHNMSYLYGRMKCHVAGKGILGFGELHTYDLLLNSHTNKQVQLDADCQPSTVIESTSVGGSTATTNTAYSKFQRYSGKKAWFVYPTSASETDLDGNTINKTFQFDTSKDGVPTRIVQSHNDGTEVTKYQSYTRHGGRYLPTSILKTTTYTGKSGFSQMKQLAYNNKGQVQTSVSHSNTAAPVTTTFTYDDFGNVLTSTTSATGVETVSKTYEYDNTNRFVTYQRERQQVLNYTYDQWGNMLTKTDNTRSSYPYTISYTYDNWGNLLSESLPTGQLTTYTRGWNPDGTTFFVTQGTGQPWTKTWYDKLGQKTRVQSISWLDTPEEETFTYNAKGQLIEHARITGSGTNGHGTYEEMQYDLRGRLTSKVGTGQPMVNITYGNNTVTTTSAGRSVTRQSNLWGNVIQVTDTAGTVSYSYGSHGKPMSVSFGGNTVTMSYDVRGRQMKITDPDAGQNTFTYDAYDRVLTECDAQNNKHYYTYNAYGRLVRDSVGIYVTSYVYGNRPTNRGLLTSTHTGDCTIYYTYDEYGRRLRERRSYSGVGTWDETLSYNSIGQIASAQYSNGPTVTYTYDAYGYKDETRANGTLICKPQLHTGWEVIDKCGTNLVRHWNFGDDSRLSDIALYDPVTMMGHDQAYWYDSATGNLEERWGMFSDNEIFYYDALDRLTHVYCTPGGPDVTSYAPNGNITSQTGIGSYYYQGTKPHAVSGVDNTNGQIPLDNQTIYWNSLGKVSSVVGGGYTQSFVYGPDGQRWKSRLLQGSTEKRVVYYMGNCEQVQQNGNTRRLYFLDGGAIYVKQDNKPDSIWFMFTDRQSSVTAIVDYAGNELFCASYDAWGRQTVTTNQIGLIRGYTGHEMLTEYGLINMNGRLYDPLLGRFLSTDNFVQEPGSTQSFNRYSYCLNNPLKYNDPSGEFFHLIIGAAVGGMINWMMHRCQYNAAGLGYFFVGAVAGALSTGVGAGISSSLPVTGQTSGGFSAGFLGSATATTATSSFVSGALIGGGAGVSGGFLSGIGNELVRGGSLGKALYNGAIEGITDGAIGAAVGGIMSGLDASFDDRRFWDGAKIEKEVLVNHNIPKVSQKGTYDCLPASVEAVDESFGGDITQEQIRSVMGGDPNKDGLIDVDVWKKYKEISGHECYIDNQRTELDPLEAAEKMQASYRVAINLSNAGDIGHSVVMQQVTLQTAIKPNGRKVEKFLYYVMDPAQGGAYRRISSRSVRKAFNIFYIK